MRRKLKLFFSLMMGIIFYLPASAYDFEVDGIYYNIVSLEDLTCEVTYDPAKKSNRSISFYESRGSSAAYSWLETTYPSYVGDVVIPESVIYKGRELTVIGLGEYAFLNCGLKSLSLPSSIKNIKEVVVDSRFDCYAGAFDYCNIESLTIGNAYCLQMFNQSYARQYSNRPTSTLKNLILSEDFIGPIDVNFAHFSELINIISESLLIPIFSGEIPFSNEQYKKCNVYVPFFSIESYQESVPWSNFVHIYPNSENTEYPTVFTEYDFASDGFFFNLRSVFDHTCEVTNISGGHAVNNGSYSLINIEVPEKTHYCGKDYQIIGIGDYAFHNCRDISNITLPSQIKEIGSYAFKGCPLTSIVLPPHIEYIFITPFEQQTKIICGNSYALSQLSSYPTLCISSDFNDSIKADFTNSGIDTLISYSNTPPVFSGGTHFSNDQYLNLAVFVPEEAVSSYRTADVWKDFWELKAMKSVNSISLTETNLSLEPKQTFQLIPTVLPEDAFDPSVIWSSSNPNVATVDSNGLVTAITKGDAIITVSATDGSGVTAECSVHVDLLVKEITLSEKEIGLEPGVTQKLEVALSPSEAFVKEVVWSSEDENVASVDQSGNVTANNIGITNINVSTTDGSNLTASCKVTVAEFVKSIVVSPLEATINEGETIQLTCEVSPESATYKDVIWSSEDEDIATVNSEGVVTAVSSGNVKIKATASDGSNVFGESTIIVEAVTMEENGICYQRNSTSSLKIIANSDSPYSGDFIVPSSAMFDGQEMPVTEIGIGAFTNCENLISIVIPNTITKIKEPTFDGCSNLEYVKICNGSVIDNNIDILFPDSPIKDLYVGSDAVTYNEDSRILGLIKGLTLGNSVSTFPQSKVFKNLKYFIMEDGDMPIVEPDDYCISSTSLINSQEIRDPHTYIYYRLFYLITYTHLSPILTALQDNVLDYIHIGREVKCIEVDTSKSEEKIPTTAGSRYQEFGYYDEVNYQYQELIPKTDYNRNPIESIEFEKQEVILAPNDNITLKVLFQPSNASFRLLNWSSSDERIATVDWNGVVYKHADGEVTITAVTTDGSNLSATCKIIDPIKVEEIILNETSVSLYENETIQLTAIVKPENATESSLIWISSNEEVATVSDDGLVQAMSAGHAIITAKCGDVTAECNVEILPGIVAKSISLNESLISIIKGNTFQLVAKIDPEDTSDKTIVWTSNNETVAAVSSNGLITANGIGNTQIVASCGEVSAVCEVTVNPILAEKITLNENNISITKGKDFQLVATIAPEDTEDKTLVWETDNEKVATVSDKGLVIAIEVGTAKITASCGEVSAVCEVVVTDIDGVDNVLQEDEYITVYTVNGLIFKENIPAGELNNLAPGIYVIKTPKGSFKIQK